VNIGDFAESLINAEVGDIKSGKRQVSHTVDNTWKDPSQPDITSVAVPEAFSAKVLSESFNIAPKEPLVEQETPQKDPQDNRLERLSQIMSEAQQILESLSTTVGMLGAGPMLGGQKKKKDYRNSLEKLRRRRRR
jgi:hypothetical protein